MHSDGYFYAYHGDLSSPITVVAGSSPEIHPNGNWSCVGLLNGFSVNNSLSYGIEESDTFNAEVAWKNRNAIQLMLRNMFVSNFYIVGFGETAWILGSIHPLRNNINIHITNSSKLRGRYDDPSIPESFTSQSGGMIGMVLYQDPDNGNFTVTGNITNANIILDGDLSTEYSAGHSQTHNNNCIGYFKSVDCSVVGLGGVSESDHKGINFDGDCVNPVIRVEYINGTSNNAFGLKGDAANLSDSNSRIGKISNLKFDGGGTDAVGFVSFLDDVNIQIDEYENTYNVSSLVRFDNVTRAELRVGKTSGLDHLLRFTDTQYVSLSSIGDNPAIVYDSNRLCVRTVEPVDVPLKQVSIINFIADENMIYPFSSDINAGTFDKLTIKDCDFRNSPSTFEYYKDLNSAKAPSIYDVSDNVSPSGGYIVDTRIVNNLNYPSGNLISGSVSGFSYDMTVPDFSYNKLSVRVSDSGNLYVKDYYIPLISGTGGTIKETIGTNEYDITSSGNIITFTRTSGTGSFVNVIAHN